MKSIRNKNGFTLMEVLLAIVIFAIVIGAVYSSYRITFENISSTENKLTSATMASNGFDCITEDLKNISFDETHSFIAEATDTNQLPGINLSFTTTHQLQTHPDDTIDGSFRVNYSTFYDEISDSLQLYRASNPQYEDTGNETATPQKGWLIAEQLRSVRFLYMDENGSEEEQWLAADENNETAQVTTPSPTLPIMVRLEFTFKLPIAQEQTATKAEDATFSTAIALTPSRKQ